MARRFNFENALAWPFTAPHVATFPWIFAATFALLYMALFALVGFAARGDIASWIAFVETIDDTTPPDAALEAVFGGMMRFLPWITILSLASWVLWAMFETASQRRYIWGKPFSLGFGGDEMRMMVVGLLWGLLSVVLIMLPFFLLLGSTFATVFSNLDNPDALNTPEFEQQVGLQVLGMFGLLIIFFPLYVFFATRLAPSFGLTVKDKRIRFFDAWSVSRGRFWPILGAYVILAIAGSTITQVISAIAQVIFMPAMTNLTEVAERGENPMTVFSSPAFIAPMAIFFFISLFLQGLLQHIVGGPAAFAARNDPAGSVEDAASVDAFS